MKYTDDGKLKVLENEPNPSTIEYPEKTGLLQDKEPLVAVLEKPIPFITCDEDGYFHVSDEASEYLNKVQSHKIAVVSIAGLYRTGKSYLLNLLLGKEQLLQPNSTFGVGGTVNAFTKGIWIWGQPLDDQISTHGDKHEIHESESRKNLTVIFMDTEGLGSVQRSQTEDTRIFALALLLSNTFIYNSRGVIDSSAIDELSLVVNLTKHIQTQAKQQAESPEIETNNQDGIIELASFFPSFVWVVRDFTLQLEENGEEITSNEYLERALKPQNGQSEEISKKNNIRSLLSTFFPERKCITMVRPLHDEQLLRDLISQPYESLRPEFKNQVETLKKIVMGNIKPKQLMGKPLNGPMLVSLSRAYVEAFNSGCAPVISSAWDQVLQEQSEMALADAVKNFKDLFQKATSCLREKGSRFHDKVCSIPMTDDEIDKIFKDCKQSSMDILQKNISSDDTDLKKKIRIQFIDAILKVWREYVEINYNVSSKYCNFLLEELYEPISRAKIELTSESYEDAVISLETHSKEYMKNIKSMIESFNKDALGPAKNAILPKFIGNKVLSVLIEWSCSISAIFRLHRSRKEKEISAARENLKSLEGKNNATSSILSKQKESYEKALQNVKEQLEHDRSVLRYEIEMKKEEINRVLDQMNQMKNLQKETTERLDKEMDVTKEEINRLEQMASTEVEKRVIDVKCAGRELLEIERAFHNEEKIIISQHQELLSKSLELEKKIGEQQMKHMKECFEIEQTNRKRLQEARAIHDKRVDEIKEKTKMEIRELKDKYEMEIKSLEKEIQQEEAYVVSLREEKRSKEINNNRQIVVRPGRHSSRFSRAVTRRREECNLQ